MEGWYFPIKRNMNFDGKYRLHHFVNAKSLCGTHYGLDPSLVGDGHEKCRKCEDEFFRREESFIRKTKIEAQKRRRAEMRA